MATFETLPLTTPFRPTHAGSYAGLGGGGDGGSGSGRDSPISSSSSIEGDLVPSPTRPSSKEQTFDGVTFTVSASAAAASGGGGGSDDDGGGDGGPLSSQELAAPSASLVDTMFSPFFDFIAPAPADEGFDQQQHQQQQEDRRQRQQQQQRQQRQQQEEERQRERERERERERQRQRQREQGQEPRERSASRSEPSTFHTPTGKAPEANMSDADSNTSDAVASRDMQMVVPDPISPLVSHGQVIVKLWWFLNPTSPSTSCHGQIMVDSW